MYFDNFLQRRLVNSGLRNTVSLGTCRWFSELLWRSASLFSLSMNWAHLDVRSGHCVCYLSLMVLTPSKTLEALIINNLTSLQFL